jgi:hypothetical protein
MQLVPSMIGVIDPSAGETDVVPHVRCREMASVTGHELDKQ